MKNGWQNGCAKKQASQGRQAFINDFEPLVCHYIITQTLGEECTLLTKTMHTDNIRLKGKGK